MKKQGSKKSTTQSSSLRIIGGQWRGRKLTFAESEGLRPTGDRIRETLFNWLQLEIPNAHCLDLFSGSGALGLEALSRGASSVLMLEKNAQAVQQIQRNLQLLPDHQGRVTLTDTLNYLRQEPQSTFDVVFLDPPFSLNLWGPVIEALEEYNWLSDRAAVYIEAPKNHSLKTPENWQPHRQKSSGHVNYCLFYRDAPS